MRLTAEKQNFKHFWVNFLQEAACGFLAEYIYEK